MDFPLRRMNLLDRRCPWQMSIDDQNGSWRLTGNSGAVIADGKLSENGFARGFHDGIKWGVFSAATPLPAPSLSFVAEFRMLYRVYGIFFLEKKDAYGLNSNDEFRVLCPPARFSPRAISAFGSICWAAARGQLRALMLIVLDPEDGKCDGHVWLSAYGSLAPYSYPIAGFTALADTQAQQRALQRLYDHWVDSPTR